MAQRRNKGFYDREKAWPRGIDFDNIFYVDYHQFQKLLNYPFCKFHFNFLMCILRTRFDFVYLKQYSQIHN
jgi:hypothetical protein